MESDAASGVQMVAYREMLQAMEDRANGRLKFEIFHMGQHPYQPFDSLEVVRDGMSDMFQTEGVDVTGVLPIMGAVELPFLMPDEETALRIRDRHVSEIINPYLRENYNQFVVAGILLGGGSVHANKELNSFDAVKGQKIRVFNKPSGQFVEIMGGVPTTVEFEEIYGALDKGVIDGAMTAIWAAYDFKWYEVVSYSTLWDYFYGTDFFVMNLDSFNELPEDLQDILMDTAAEHQDINQKGCDELVFVNLAKAIYDYGAHITKMDLEFRAEVAAQVGSVIWDPWVKETGDLAVEFFKILEEEGVIQ